MRHAILKSFRSFFKYYLLYIASMSVYVWESMRLGMPVHDVFVRVGRWRSENNFQHLVLFFHHEFYPIRSLGMHSMQLYLGSHSAIPTNSFWSSLSSCRIFGTSYIFLESNLHEYRIVDIRVLIAHTFMDGWLHG